MRNIVALFLSFLALPLSAAITGNVMSGGGQPIAGARVSIYAAEMPEARFARLLSASPERVPLTTVETDPKGNFSLPSPKEAVVELHIAARGYEPLAWRVENDGDLGAIALVDRPMRAGTVKSGGKPVPNALVVITYPGTLLGGPGGAEYLTRTDAEGRYEAPDVKPQGASIAVIHPDYVIETGFASVPRAGARDMNVSLVPGTPLTGRAVAADGTTPVPNATIYLDSWPRTKSGDDGAFTIARAPQKWNVAVARTDTLMGVLPFAAGKGAPVIRMEKMETISGRTIDAQTKRPVAGTLVQLSRSTPSLPRIGITDAMGSFSIRALPGESKVYVAHPAYTFPTNEIIATAGQRVVSDIALTPYARASGVVMDEEERPVPAALVYAQEGTVEGAPSRALRFFSATSGADGRFSVRVQPDTDVRLRAAKKGLPHAKSGAMKLAGGERKTGIVMTIPTGVAVTGRVVDENDEPLSDVAVLTKETPTQGWSGPAASTRQVDDDTVRTAKDGTFALRLESGMYDFTFLRDGFAPGHVRAQRIAADEVTPIAAKLERAVEIAGRVTRGGAPVQGVRISSATSEMTTSAADGSFTLTGLTAGMTRLMLNKPGEPLRAERRITAPARDVVIELPLGVTISGRVTAKATRSAVRDFEIHIERPQTGTGSWMPQKFTSDDGTFTLRHGEPGPLHLIAKAAGYARGRLSIDAQEGKDVSDAALELDRAARLTGRITGENGLPLSEASVRLQPSGGYSGRPPHATTNANGEYVVEGLDPGESTFRITHPKHTSAVRTVTVAGGEAKLDVQLSAGHRVTGTVVDEQGAGVAEAEVRALGEGAMAGRTVTNASGVFEIETLAAGRYRFDATKRGLAPGVLENVDVGSSGPLVITMRAGGTIYGRVIGLTAAEAAHTIVRAQQPRSMLSSPVDPQGNYRIEGVPAGSVRVMASVAPQSSGTTRASASQEVQVIAGTPLQVDIEMRGDAVMRGRVTRNGAPLVDGSVSFNARGERGTHATGRTDHEGRYVVSGLADGEYSVTVSEMRGGANHTTTHTVRGSGTLDLDFKAGSVRGRAVDAGTGERLAGISVRFQPSTHGSFMVTTDNNGMFSMPNLRPGTYKLSAWGDGYAIQRRELAVSDTGADEIELRLTRGATTTVLVVDARNGRPIAANAAVLDAQGRVIEEIHRVATGDPAQGVRLPLPPGTYTVQISAHGYAPARTRITAPSSRTVALTPGGSIRIQSRHTVPRKLRITTPNGAIPHHLRPGLNVIANLTPGTYTLDLMNDAGGVADTLRVTVIEGQTVDASI